MRKNANRTASVSITEFSKKGNGIGTTLNQNGEPWKVEVPFTIPGDTAEALLLRKRGGLFGSLLQQITIPAPTRIAPKCKHFSVCGGCRWQQIPYTEQLQNKEEMVRRYFGDLITPDVAFHPIIPCGSPWQYRNKMEFSFSSDAAKTKYLGLIIDASGGKVVNLTECHLVNPWFIEALEATRAWWEGSDLEAYHIRQNTGSLRTLTVREGKRTGDRMVMLTVSGNPDYALHRPQINSFLAAIRKAIEPPDPDCHLSVFLRIHQIAKGIPTNFYEMHLYGPDHIKETLLITTIAGKEPIPLTFTISPSAFFQPNSSQAEKLYSLALQHAAIPQDAVAYDLYCGTGTLGICMAKHAKQVIGIEISPESALDARTNATSNGIENFTVYTGAVHEILKNKEFPKPDLLMIDPPRVGLEVAGCEQIIALGAPSIVYISCNPATQAVDVAELVKHGYRLVSIQPVDQFPQTIHIENIALLVK